MATPKKKIVFTSFVISLLMLAACESEKDRSAFIDVYGDVLKARLENQNSINAQFAVDSVLEANNYTLKTFGEALEEFARNDPSFTLVIDSLRTKISESAKVLDSLSSKNFETLNTGATAVDTLKKE